MQWIANVGLVDDAGAVAVADNDALTKAARSAASASTSSAAASGSANDLEGLTPADVPQLLDAGAQAFALGNFALAAEKLSLASQLKAEEFGPKSRECASTLFLYGQALLANAVQKNGVLGETVDESQPAVVSSSSSATPCELIRHTSINPVYPGGDDEAEEPEEEDEAEDEEMEAEGDEEGAPTGDEDAVALDDLQDEDDVDDLEIAWETFEAVRLIYAESLLPDDKPKLAEVHLALGDVSLENGNFDQAIADFLAALKIKQECLSADDRQLAEAHYKLALALEHSENIEDAIEQVNKTVTVLQMHRDRLAGTTSASGEDAADKSKGKKPADPISESAAKEIKEIEKLLEEMSAKLSDLAAALDKEEQEEDLERQDDSAAASSAKAVDISNLVKKDRKRADDDEETVSKKAKTTDGATDE
eukprot:jgi/Hompol1/1280/HPOL_001157-RA